jgi:hypothetical protein
MPMLSAFLGHGSPEATYYYLQATPQLLALAAQRLEQSSRVSACLVPEGEVAS